MTINARNLSLEDVQRLFGFQKQYATFKYKFFSTAEIMGNTQIKPLIKL